MINTDIKKLIWRIFGVLWNIFAIIGVCCVIYALYILFFDDEGWCLSSGHGVWDDDKKICRQDCLTWTKENGCVPITEENILKKEKGLLK